MRITDLIESVDFEFPGYSETVQIRGNDNVRYNNKTLFIDITTPFELTEYFNRIDGREVEIEEIRGEIARTIEIKLKFVDVLNGYSDFEYLDIFKAANISECSDPSFSLAKITEEINADFLSSDLLHGEEGLEIFVNLVSIEE